MNSEADENPEIGSAAAKGGSESDGELQFRYDRRRRLEHAPESVRWLASRWGGKRDGLFKTMLATRASRILFLTIVALAVVFNVVPLLQRRSNEGKIGADVYSIKAFWFEGRVFVSVLRSGAAVKEDARETITLRASTGAADSGAAVIGVFVVGLDEKEDFRLAVEASAGKPAQVAVRIETHGASLDLIAKVE